MQCNLTKIAAETSIRFCESEFFSGILQFNRHIVEFLIQIHTFPFRWINQSEQFEFHSQTMYEISYKFVCVVSGIWFTYIYVMFFFQLRWIRLESRQRKAPDHFVIGCWIHGANIWIYRVRMLEWNECNECMCVDETNAS